MAARAAVNASRERLATARAMLGSGGDTKYAFRDNPDYSVEVSRLLSSEASQYLLDAQAATQAEVNALDSEP